MSEPGFGQRKEDRFRLADAGREATLLGRVRELRVDRTEATTPSNLRQHPLAQTFVFLPKTRWQS